jgi:hypothetical protein
MPRMPGGAVRRGRRSLRLGLLLPRLCASVGAFPGVLRRRKLGTPRGLGHQAPRGLRGEFPGGGLVGRGAFVRRRRLVGPDARWSVVLGHVSLPRVPWRRRRFLDDRLLAGRFPRRRAPSAGSVGLGSAPRVGSRLRRRRLGPWGLRGRLARPGHWRDRAFVRSFVPAFVRSFAAGLREGGGGTHLRRRRLGGRPGTSAGVTGPRRTLRRPVVGRIRRLPPLFRPGTFIPGECEAGGLIRFGRRRGRRWGRGGRRRLAELPRSGRRMPARRRGRGARIGRYQPGSGDTELGKHGGLPIMLGQRAPLGARRADGGALPPILSAYAPSGLHKRHSFTITVRDRCATVCD